MSQAIEHLVGRYPLISDQIDSAGLRTLLEELEKVLEKRIPGDVVEFGCYSGTSSLFLRRLLDHCGENSRALHVYDSFAGLPPKSAPDMSSVGADFQAGALAVSKKTLINEFKKAGVRLPEIHKGWFKDLRPEELPDVIAFAFLDGDFYQSIFDALKLTWPRLHSGGRVVIDDYGREALPGVERAVRQFFQAAAPPLSRRGNLAIIQKLT